MSGPVRQSNLFAAEDYRKVFRSYRNINFTSYDFETIKKSMVEYIKQQHPEDFNDYIASSEFIAIIELLAYLGTSLAMRTELNSRENFLDTAERRESVIRLARMLSYSPKRNIPAQGLFKIKSVSTNEPITDSAGNNLKGVTVFWDDSNDENAFEKFITILNAAFNSSNPFGKPVKRGNVLGVDSQLYQINSVLPREVGKNITINTEIGQLPFSVINPNFDDNGKFYERHIDSNESDHLIYRNDGNGVGSNETGFFVYLKQGLLRNVDFNLSFPLKNRVLDVPNQSDINEEDVYFQEVDQSGNIINKWTRVPSLVGNNVIYNDLNLEIRDIYNVITDVDDSIKLKFTDGNFGNVPKGTYRLWVRKSANDTFQVLPAFTSGLSTTYIYTGNNGQEYTLNILFGTDEVINNSVESETNEQIKANASAVFYTQNRMVNAEDYNVFPLTQGNEIQKVKSVNRTHSGHSRFIDINDPTGMVQNVKLIGEDGALYRDYEPERSEFEITTFTNLDSLLSDDIIPFIQNQRLHNFYYNEYYYQAKNINPSDFDYTSLEYLWCTLPRKETNNTGFMVDPNASGSSKTWIYDLGGFPGQWSDGITGYDPEDGIPLTNNLYTISVFGSSIEEGDVFVSQGRIFMRDGFTPVTFDSIFVDYKIPVNVETPTTKYFTEGAFATFFNVADPSKTKGVAIKGISNGGIPNTFNPTEIGPVEVSRPVTDTWQLGEIIPGFRWELNQSEQDLIIAQMELQNDFGIGYVVDTDTWRIVPTGDLDLGNENLDINNFDLTTENTSNDSTWLVYFNFEPGVGLENPKYVVTTRGMRYIFESLKEVRFFYSPEQRAINIQTGRSEEDVISVLDINTKPESDSETFEYDNGNWENGPISFASSDGIPLKLKNNKNIVITPTTDNVISQTLSADDIDDRGVLQTSSYAWQNKDMIKIEYLQGLQLTRNIDWNIDKMYVLEDGYFDQQKVEIKPVDTDFDAVPDFPLSFDDFINRDDKVWFERYFDFDHYEYFRPWVTGYAPVTNPALIDPPNECFANKKIVDVGLFMFETDDDLNTFIETVEDLSSYIIAGEFPSPSLATLRLRQFNFAKLFENKTVWVEETDMLYEIPLIEVPDPPVRPIVTYNRDRFTEDFNHYWRNGRSFTQDECQEYDYPLHYHWKHFAPSINRIDPSVSNIIDIFILTTAYHDAVQVWKKNGSATSLFPVEPTTEDLRVQFGELGDYKMLSDQLVFRPAVYKTLFGPRAATELRAKFKVVKLPSTFISDNEIKSKVIAAIDNYFAIENWDFGESFYYTELAAYIHHELSSLISTVVIVPEKEESQFGDLFQIKAEPNELFLPVATVQNVEIVASLTDANLRIN